MNDHVVVALIAGIICVQLLLAYIAVTTGLKLTKDKSTQEALPLIALVIAPALTIGTSLTPAVVTPIGLLEASPPSTPSTPLPPSS